MQSTPCRSNGFGPARRRTFSIAAVFDKKREGLAGSTGLHEASKAASIIDSSPVPSSSLEKTTIEHGSTPEQQKPDTPPASPQSSFDKGRREHLGAEIKQQRQRPQTPMDFTFQSMGFAVGNSRASIDDVRSQLAIVTDELKTLQEKLDIQDQTIKALRTQLDEMMEKYEEAILNAEKNAIEKEELKDQVQRLRTAWTAEREMRKELEEEIEMRLDKERQLQARIRRMGAQDSLSVLARARKPMGDVDQRSKLMEKSRRGTVNGLSRGGSYPFNQSSLRELEL